MYGCSPFPLIHIVDIPLLKNSKMIRRNPTLIPMGDADVQDVRDMVFRETLEKVQSLPAGIFKEDDANVQQLLSELKAKRLGLEAGVFTIHQCLLRILPISKVYY